MTSIISFISNKIVYILLGIILILCLVISVQYSSYLKANNKIDSLNYEISSLQEKNMSLEQSLAEMTFLRDKENEELKKTRDRIESLQNQKEKALKGVENVYKNKDVIDRPLPPDVARMLNEVYESVHSNSKPNP